MKDTFRIYLIRENVGEWRGRESERTNKADNTGTRCLIKLIDQNKPKLKLG